MRRIPLFPLPVVLLPGAVLPLHIFESRYRRMVARCLEYDRRFGIVFHDSDRFGPFMMEAGRVGCVAHIAQFELLDGGRSIVLTQGEDRFVIADGIESDEPYYEALVEDLVDDPPLDDVSLRRRRDRSVGLFRAVLETLPAVPEGLPALDGARDVSFALASTIETDPAWLQDLLSMTDEESRLDRIDTVFEAAIGDPLLDSE